MCSSSFKRFCIGVAALCIMGTSYVQAADPNNNPWGSSMEKFNTSLSHGSGVQVDLGNTKTVNNKQYREPGGRCPVIGKVIHMLQPTTDPSIWPNDYTARVPLKGSKQDTSPLGGGLGMWETTPVSISPLTLEELKTMADKLRAQPKPNAEALNKLNEVQDDIGLCAWWTWTNVASSQPRTALNNKYRYPFVWNPEKKLCTILAIAMQKLDGPGKYCTSGNSEPKLQWPCFYPEKVESQVVYGSAYVRMDHKTACSEAPIRGAHFGVWNGSSCSRMIPRGMEKVATPADCGKAAFRNSASDNPTRYTRAPDQSGMGVDNKLAVPTLWTPGAFGSDQPHSRGVGTNYANWYQDGTCEIYDTVPTCFTFAPYQYSFTALGGIDPRNSELPPCTEASEGWVIWDTCECGHTKAPWTCENGEWVGGDDTCDCTTRTIVLGIGLGLGIPLALLGAYMLYRFRKGKNREKEEEEKSLLSDGHNESFLKAQQKKHKHSDFVQEAEPSFWGETQQEQTNVVLDDGEDGTPDAYY